MATVAIISPKTNSMVWFRTFSRMLALSLFFYIGIMLNLQISLETIGILTMFSLPTQKYDIFLLLRSLKISLCMDYSFQCIDFAHYLSDLSQIFYHFGAAVNDTIFQFSISDSSLLIYRKHVDFCMLLYLVTFLNSVFSSFYTFSSYISHR